MAALLLTTVTFFSTLAGGLFALRYSDRLHYIMSFTAGVILGVCFFDIMPEIFRITLRTHGAMTPAMVALVVGFLLFHVSEKTIVLHASHEGEYAPHPHAHPRIGVLSAGGLAFHSFLDGVGIGLGFQINSATGLLIALAVIAHDFADGLNTVTLMLSNKNPRPHAVLFLLLDAATPLLGVVSTFVFHISDDLLRLYLGFFAGFLLYIGASDLLPEAHSEHSSYGMIALTLLGTAFIFLATRFA